jgi:hypothetical protein
MYFIFLCVGLMSMFCGVTSYCGFLPIGVSFCSDNGTCKNSAAETHHTPTEKQQNAHQQQENRVRCNTTNNSHQTNTQEDKGPKLYHNRHHWTDSRPLNITVYESYTINKKKSPITATTSAKQPVIKPITEMLTIL